MSPDPGPVHHGFETDRGDAGARLDRVVMRHLAHVPGLSRTRVQRWIAAGQVRVDGMPVPRVAARLRAGQQVDVVHLVPRPRRSRTDGGPVSAPALSVLYEDARLLALDKPAGVVVHPTIGQAATTVLDLVRGRAEREGWTPRLVHRLDRDTSGVLLVAKDVETFRWLAARWHSPAVRKEYLAAVVGRPPHRSGDIRSAVIRDPLDRRRMMARPGDEGDSWTRYRVLAGPRRGAPGLSLLLCELRTGRTHQVRVHLASLGCPIVGDRVYGHRRTPATLAAPVRSAMAHATRQALHAWRLVVPLPGSTAPRDVLCLVSPPPPDFRALADAAGLGVALDRVMRATRGPRAAEG